MTPTDSHSHPPPNSLDHSFPEPTGHFQILSSFKSGETNPNERASEPTRRIQNFTPLTHEEIKGVEKVLNRFPEVDSEFIGFHLMAELGKGTFGCVYLARQGELADRPVALKVSPDVGKESRSLARLQHPNIVPIHSVHHAPPFQAICMPFLGAKTLTDLVAAQREALSGKPTSGFDAFPNLRGKSRTEIVLKLVRGIADGLCHAHDRGVLHCDLKPANVLLSDEGEPMLLDFNLAQDFHQATKGTIGGSLSYMAPEHLRAFLERKGGVDAQCDLYSLGVILFELLTSFLPFPSYKELGMHERLTKLLDARLQGVPQLVTTDVEVTPAVRSIVRKLLEVDPKHRYQSAVELRDDLDRHLADRPLKYAPDRSWGERWNKFRRRNPRMTSVVSLSFLSLLLVGILTAAVVVREKQLARSEAREAARGIEDDRRELEFVLTAQTAVHQLERGLAYGYQTLERHGLTETAPPDRLNKLTNLPESEREKTFADLSEVVYLTASGHVLKSKQSKAADRENELLRAEKLLEKMAGLQGNGLALRGVLLLQADIARTRGELEEANRLEKLAAETPLRSAREYHHAAVLMVEQKRYIEATRLLEEAVRLDPKDFNSWFQIGFCKSELELHRDAASTFSTCLALRPDFYAAYYNRGLAYHRQGRFTEAKQDLDEAIRLNPRFVPAYLQRALASDEMGGYASAETDLTEAIRLLPNNSRLHLLRARVREKLRDKPGATEDREVGLRLVPADALEWVTRGLAKVPFGPNEVVPNFDPKGAVADFDAALALEPNYLDALRNKAHVLSRYLKDTEGSIAVLTETIRHYPKRSDPWAGRGVLLARLGKREEAFCDAERALALDYSPQNQYQVAGIYALLSKDDPAARSEAFRLLAAALGAGFGFDYLEIDRDLDLIRDDPRFRRTIEGARKKQ